MMRLLFDHQVFQLQQRGGASRLFFEILKRLSSDQSCKTTLYAGLHQNLFPIESLNSANLRVWGQRTQNPGFLNPASKLNRLTFPAFAMLSGSQIYHPTYYVDALPFSRIKKVATALDMIHELFPNQFSGDDLTTKRKRQLFHTAELIISISEHTKKDLIDIFRIPAEKIRVIPLAQSLPTPQAIKSSVSEKPYFLYVGLRGGYKNFSGLLSAFGKAGLAKDFDLVCFGGGPLLENEKNEINDLGISAAIHQISGDDQVLANTYARAWAFVYPSLYEGFGIPPLEAMACGCPVIACRSSSIPEVVGDAAQMFSPDSEESLIEALRRIAQDHSLRQRLIPAGLGRERQFSWDKTYAEHLKVYQELS